MRDHADALQNFIESTKKCCSFMSGLLCSLLPRHCTNLVSKVFLVWSPMLDVGFISWAYAVILPNDHDIALQVGSRFVDSNKFLQERDPRSTVMDAGEAIEITSSGSDSSSWDLDEYREILDAPSPLKDSASSANHRVLPQWDSAVATTSRGND